MHLLGGLDLDSLSLGRFGLRQHNLENTVLVARPDLRDVDRRRESEGAGEAAVEALDPMVTLVPDVLLAHPLAAEREDAVLDMDVDVLLLHAGQLRLEHEALFLLENVHRRRPSSPGGLLIAARLAGHISEESAHSILHVGGVSEWIEAHESHFFHLPGISVLHECSLRSLMGRVKSPGESILRTGDRK